MEAIQVLVVSDDNRIRQGIASIFSTQEKFHVINSLNISETMEQCSYCPADLIILDLTTIKKDAVELVKNLKKRCPFSKVIAIISNDNLEGLADIIVYGIDSCIPEGLMCCNFIKAIELACSTGLFIFPLPAKNQMLQYIPPKTTKVLDMYSFKENTTTSIVEELTKRELEILELMAQNRTNKEIGKMLYISEPTVKTHVSSILHKLGQSNRAQAILFAYKTGLLKDSLA